MAVKGTQGEVQFTSLPNFRPVDPQYHNGRRPSLVSMLYRSSRPDFLTSNEVDKFSNQLGIRCIIDFRSVKEYKKANGSKLLDTCFHIFKVTLPFRLKYKANDNVNMVMVKKASAENQSPKKHVMVDFFKMNYVWAVFIRAPWHFRIFSLLYLIVDVVLNTHYRYFVSAFARKVLNPVGLTGQYIDMLQYSQGPICAALKLLTDANNLPAVINCAHGKDRTGIVSALVLGCLGRSNEYIAFDYAKSETELAPIKDRVHSEIVGRFSMCETFTGAKSDTMLETLKYIDEQWGSIPNYLESIGFSASEQAKLRYNLLGDTSTAS